MIKKKIISLIKKIFKVSNNEIKKIKNFESYSIKDLKNFDSLSLIRFLIEIEKIFNIKFKSNLLKKKLNINNLHMIIKNLTKQ